MAKRVDHTKRDEAIRKARVEHGLSMKQLCVRFDVKEYAVRDALRGHPIKTNGRPGAKNSQARLDDEKVRDIRKRYDNEGPRALAKEFKVSAALICHIKAGRNWAHVT